MNETKNDSKKPNKKLLVLVGLLILILVIIIAVVQGGKKKTEGPQNTNTDNQATEQPAANTEAPATAETETQALQATMKGSRVEAPGAAVITADNRVVDQSGVELKSNAVVQSPEAPKQTQPVDIKALAATVVKLKATANGFEPAEFRIKKGEPVTLSLTNELSGSEILIFRDPSLAAVMLAVKPGETRAITFQGPDKAGEYIYASDFPGHSGSGKMIVQ